MRRPASDSNPTATPTKPGRAQPDGISAHVPDLQAFLNVILLVDTYSIYPEPVCTRELPWVGIRSEVLKQHEQVVPGAKPAAVDSDINRGLRLSPLI